MNSNRVPGADIKVSPICLGTMTFGDPVEKKNAIRIVHAALDQGINFIDTADMYEGYNRQAGSTGGVAESILGEALADRRCQAVVTTKVGNSVGGTNYQGSGLGREHILHQIELSLQRMKTDYIDIYELHAQDPKTPLIETLEVMTELINAGKVLHWGFSNVEPTQILEMIQVCDENNWPRPVVAQPPYSWLRRDAESDYLPECRRFDLAITPYQPLQGGLLTGKYHRGEPLPPESRAIESQWLSEPDNTLYDQLDQFESEARNVGLKPAQYAIRWLLQQSGITSVVVGVRNVVQLSDLLVACS